MLHNEMSLVANWFLESGTGKVQEKRKGLHVNGKHELMDLMYRVQMEMLLTLRLLMSYIYGAPSKARNANVVYIWTYVWQR